MGIEGNYSKARRNIGADEQRPSAGAAYARIAARDI